MENGNDSGKILGRSSIFNICVLIVQNANLLTVEKVSEGIISIGP